MRENPAKCTKSLETLQYSIMSAPTMIDLKSYRENCKIELPDSWMITTSMSDDVIWNIALAYLNSFPLSQENELTRHIKCLAGDQEVNQNIRISVEEYNPFLDRDTCFSDKVLSNVVARFREGVEDFIKNNKQNFTDEPEYLRCFVASSKLLSCNIAFIDLKDRMLKSYKETIDEKHILILRGLKCSNNNKWIQEKFSFGLPEEVGMHKQRLALAEILKKTRMINNCKEMVGKICMLPGITANLLISLLKNGCGEAIPFIYESPNVLSNLTDAGLETDPRAKDSSGKSAFFHALKSKEPQLVFFLYDRATSSLLPELQCIKDDFELLKNELEAEELSEKSKSLFKGLCLFNKFQIEICESINLIRKEYSQNKIENHEVFLQKDILLSILKTYDAYFDYINEDAEDNRSRFKAFYKHIDYFDELDFFLAVMFFDNLLFLKKRLKLPNNAYSEIESNYFLFIFFRKYFQQYDNQKCFYSVSRWITFQERLSLQKQLRKFKETLENTELLEHNIMPADKDDPDKHVPTLIDLPQVYGQFIILRIHHYLNAATGLTVKDLKSILVIERCFQAMGEYCKETGLNPIQRTLILSLSKELSKHLLDIRNSLSHIKEPEKILYRYELERDVKLFGEIQKELFKIKELLAPLFFASKYQRDLFWLLHYVNPICNFRRRSISVENQMRANLSSPEIESQQSMPKLACCQNSWKLYFEGIHSSLLEKISDLNHKKNILLENTASGYKLIVKKIISDIEEALKNVKDVIPGKVVELNSHFQCLENILTYITTDTKLTECHRELEFMQYDRKSLFTELSKSENKTASSITHVTSVEESEGVRKNLSSVLEYNTQQTVNYRDPYIQFGVVLKSRKKRGNDIDDSGFSHNPAEIHIKSQVDIEIYRENSENSILQNMCDDCILLETIHTKEWEESVDLLENGANPETFAQNEENDLYFVEASTLRDNRVRANFYHDCLEREVDGPAKIMDVKKESFKRDAEKFLENYKRIADNSFHGVPDYSKENFHFENIKNYRLMLEGNVFNERRFLTKEEKVLILGSVPKEFQNIDGVKENIRNLLEKKEKLTEELGNLFSELELNNEHLDFIKKEFVKYRSMEEVLGIVHSAPDYFVNLTDTMDSGEIDQNQYDLLCEKLELSADVKNILSKLLEGRKSLKVIEKDLILKSVPKKFRNISTVKQKIRNLFEERTELTEKLGNLFSILKLDNKEMKEIKYEIENYRETSDTLRIVDGASGYFSDLTEMVESEKKLDKSQYDLICGKLRLSNDAKNILSKLLPKHNGNKLKFLRNRIQILENIFIDKNDAIKRLWEGESASKRLMLVNEKMELYLKDSEIQASVQTLLFHCMTLSQNKKLKELWNKTTILFTAVNLRNVLSHGHPLLESLGSLGIYDPYDLPSEIVGKILQLIADKNVIDCMIKMIQQSGTGLFGFKEIMYDETNEQFRDLREQIMKCDRWHSYAILIPTS